MRNGTKRATNAGPYLGLGGKFGFSLWFLSGLWVSVYGQIEVNTFPEAVQNLGSFERASSLEFAVSGDVFPEASPQNPVYLKCGLPDDAVLSETLVGPNGLPVFLAVYSFGPGSQNIRVKAAREAVALVRHVAGESAFWVRVTHPTHDWLEIQGVPTSPSPGLPVFFHLGLLPSESLNFAFGPYQIGMSNLPFNTARSGSIGDPLDENGTPVMMDLSQSNYAVGSFLLAEIRAFQGGSGIETAPDPAAVMPGGTLALGGLGEVPIGLVFEGGVPVFTEMQIEGFPALLGGSGVCERAGSFKVFFSDQLFPNASPSSPVYLRLRLSNQAVLCQTLVDPAASEPIYLALSLLFPTGGTVVAPGDSLAVVRWKAGEEAVWLKIIRPTTDWVSGGQSFPNMGTASGNLVSFSLGLSAADSLNQNLPLFQQGQANLKANTRDLSGGEAADTFADTDLSAGGLGPFNAFLWMHLKAFSGSQGVETAVEPSAISPGGDLGPNGSGIIGSLDVNQPVNTGLVLSSVPKEIDPAGNCESTGDMSFTVGGDLFPLASPLNPVYLKIELAADSRLCETLVAPGVSQPVYLALSLESQQSGATLAAPAETVSIVRWVAGESAFWLKVQHPTRTWIQDQNLGPPRIDETVKFSLGIEGSASWALNQERFARGEANLPANSRFLDPGGLEQAAGTTLKVDVSQTTMTPNPQNPWQGFYTVAPSAWIQSAGVETQADPQLITAGAPFPVFFQGKQEIAFGVVVTVDPPVVVQGLSVVTMEALVADDVDPVDYKWTDKDTGNIISPHRSVIFDPIPTGTKKAELKMRDHLGRTFFSEVTLLVNPDTFDLNNDGRNDILDLMFALPEWHQQYNVMFLISIPID